MRIPSERVGRLQCAVVGRPERGLAVGLVHAERKGPLGPGTAEELDELVAGRDHPVDVAADVDVCVEDGGSRRQAVAELLLVLLGTRRRVRCENLVHASESTRSGYHREPCPTSSSLATPSARPSCATRFRSRFPTRSSTSSGTAHGRRLSARSRSRAWRISTASRSFRSRSWASTSSSSRATRGTT